MLKRTAFVDRVLLILFHPREAGVIKNRLHSFSTRDRSPPIVASSGWPGCRNYKPSDRTVTTMPQGATVMPNVEDMLCYQHVEDPFVTVRNE